MRSCLPITFGFFCAFFLFFLITTEVQKPEKLPEPFVNPKPDPNRQAESFDWDKGDYIYKDSPKPKDTGRRRRNYPAYPDAFVQGMPTNAYRPRTEQRVNVDGKRYRVFYKENGEVELKPLR